MVWRLTKSIGSFDGSTGTKWSTSGFNLEIMLKNIERATDSIKKLVVEPKNSDSRTSASSHYVFNYPESMH
jgi:hypothetical protein